MNILRVIRETDARALNEFIRLAVTTGSIDERDLTAQAGDSTREPVLFGAGTYFGLRIVGPTIDDTNVIDAVALGIGALVRFAGPGDPKIASIEGKTPTDLAGLTSKGWHNTYVLRPGDVVRRPFARARCEVFASANGRAAIAAGTVRVIAVCGWSLEGCELPRDRAPMSVLPAYVQSSTDAAAPYGMDTQTTKDVDGTTSVELIAANPARQNLVIQNHGATNLHVHFGTGNAVDGDEAIVLREGQAWPARAFDVRVTDRVAAIRDTGAAAEKVGVLAWS